jgi:hypothetical protein
VTQQTGYIRYQGRNADAQGRFLGIFALVNTLAKQGKLTADQEQFRRANNDWYDATYPDPGAADPDIYDSDINAGANAWYKTTAQHLITRVDGYLEILTSHRIDYERLETCHPPGRVIYEDEDQIVVVPHQPPQT